MLGPVTKKNMQSTPPPPCPSLRSGHFYIKYAECAESNEESYIRFFRFLIFELLVAKEITIRLQKNKYFKRAKFSGKIEIDLTMIF